MIQGEPENENGHPGVLNSGFDGNSNDILDAAVAESGEGAAKSESKPRQHHPGQKHLPVHELKHVKVGPNSKDQDEEDEEKGHGFEDTDHKLPNLGQVTTNEDSDPQWDN